MSMALCGALVFCTLLSLPGIVGADATAMADPIPPSSAAHAQPGHGSVATMTAPLVAAHRGGFFGGQGSLERIYRTIGNGDADIIEIDLRATRDGRVLIYHAPVLEAKTNCIGRILDKTYSEVAPCRLRDSNQQLPLFSQLLTAARGHAIVNAEFKTNASIIPAIDLVQSIDDLDGVYFQVGSDRQRYALVRQYSGDANLQFKATSDDDLEWAFSRDDPHLRIIEMDRDFISSQRIAQVHIHDRLVSENTWRYQYTEERFGSSCSRAFNAGVDIAVTNNPASCSRQRNARPYSAPHRWIYSVIGRPRVRRTARFIVAGARTTLLSLQGLVSAL